MKQKAGLYPPQKSLSAFQHSSWEAPVVQVAQRDLSQACDACGKSTYGNWCFSITNVFPEHIQISFLQKAVSFEIVYQRKKVKTTSATDLS